MPPFAAHLAVAEPASLATLFLLLLPPLAAPPASAANFTCLTVGKTCQSAIEYAVPNATTYGEVVARLFNTTTTLAELLRANGLPASTPASTPLPAKAMVRVPFRCRCGSNGVGQPADGGPIYVAYPQDGLDHIARDVFDGFVTYQEIATANDIANVDHIEIGQKLRIPLPCTCDQVEGADVTHLAYSVADRDDTSGIAAKFGVAENTLLSVNKITDHKSLQQGQILDVPLAEVSALGPPTGNGPLVPGPPPSPPVPIKGRLAEQVVIPVSVLIIIALVAFVVVKHYQKKRKMENFQIVTGLKDFSYDNIKSATKNFGKDKLLGEGGFGKVYKGTFNIDRNTKDLAVKCVTNPSAAKHLKDELKILAELKHKNMVQLVGFCNNDGWFRRGRGLYVCSEFISNGPLDKKIFGSLGQPVIEWPIRYQIIRGICAGLQYLHQDHNSKILHMDLKPSNILLDEEMKPKIADFGLSRAFLNAKTHTYTDIVKGSLGYMAPEFVDHGRASRQCDIYSLGMLILGIVMRVGPPSTSRDPSGVSYINKVRDKFVLDMEATTTLKRWSAKDHEQLKKDASLEDDDSIEDVEKCVGLAFECVDVDPKKRPEAADICTRLNPNNRAHISLQVNEVQI